MGCPLKRARDFLSMKSVYKFAANEKLSPNDVRELIISSSDIFKEEITLAENFQDEFDRYKEITIHSEIRQCEGKSDVFLNHMMI